MKSKILSVLIVLSVILLSACGDSHKNENEFCVFALGDMPYKIPDDYDRFEKFIGKLNRHDHDFSVFVGDFKAGAAPCTGEAFMKIHDYFNRFKQPLVYTPGDNEWTDCKNPSAGGYNPKERLQLLRSLFFDNGKKFGRGDLRTLSESDFPEYKTYSENKSWTHKSVHFCTVHVVGSNNNYIDSAEADNSEFFERQKANLFWLDTCFKKATASDAPGLVIFIHADMFYPDKGKSGFNAILDTLRSKAEAFKKPVLLVHGDSHQFIHDKPFKISTDPEKTLMNFTRVQVFGDHDMQAVRIHFNTDDPALFSIEACDYRQ